MENKTWKILEKIMHRHSFHMPWNPKVTLEIMCEFFDELSKQNLILDTSSLSELNKIMKENLTKKGFPYKINNN